MSMPCGVFRSIVLTSRAAPPLFVGSTFAIAKRIAQTVLAMAAAALVAAQSYGQTPPKKDAAADADEKAALAAFCHGHNGPEIDLRVPFTFDGHERCLNLVAGGVTP